VHTSLFCVGYGLPLNITINYKMLALALAFIGLCVWVITRKTDNPLRSRANKLVGVGLVFFFAPNVYWSLWEIAYAILLGFGWMHLSPDYNDPLPNPLYGWLFFTLPKIYGLLFFGLGTLLALASIILKKLKQPALA